MRRKGERRDGREVEKGSGKGAKKGKETKGMRRKEERRGGAREVESGKG